MARAPIAERTGSQRTAVQARNDLVVAHNPDGRLLPTDVICRAVAWARGITLGSLKCARKDAHLVTSRQLAVLLLIVFTQRSFPAIARALARDHTTAMWACRRGVHRLATDPDFERAFLRLVDALHDKMDGAGEQHDWAPRAKRANQAPRPALSASAAKRMFQGMPSVMGDQLDHVRRHVHMASVGYASALYAEHGENAKWPTK